ncbi:galactoside 2-alpha-L-fucosyltransferase Sec1-like [Physella acuta]|uniref:galactoside 2-alpha-L-fucosyltransferase Sec1-like n=1 Tax=Physella acuta TaxID=109671 RepID=UPI0027DB0960|nr:galactoside 2-alpha-L-fucosyltransferase Sec1-like [Physella acuta]
MPIRSLVKSRVKFTFITLNLSVLAFFFLLLFSDSDKFLTARLASVRKYGPPALTNESLEVQTREDYLVSLLGDQMFLYASLLGIARAKNRQPLIEGGENLRKIFNISITKNYIRASGWPVLSTWRTEAAHAELPRINLTLRGQYQSWKYFHLVQEEIRREFTFHPEIQNFANQFYKNLRRLYPSLTFVVTFVGVHIYRGKVQRSVARKLIIAPLSYFTKAIKLMRSLLSGTALFIISSDDPLWCRENFSDQQDLIVLDSGPAAGHLAILASTTHLIISTGSFGWWAAWLADGATIYYNNVNNQTSTESEYFPHKWIGIRD